MTTLITFSLLASVASAITPELTASKSGNFRIYLGAYLQVYEDQSASMGIEEAFTHLKNGSFSSPESETLHFGYRKSAIWLAMPIANPADRPLASILEIRYAPLDYIDVYLLSADVPPGVNAIQSHAALGDQQPYGTRPIVSRNHLAPLTLKEQTDYYLMVRIQSASSLSAPMYLSSIDALYQYEHYLHIVMGIFYGIALGMLAYNFFLFLIIKDRVYLHYIFYVLGYTLFMASLDGLLYQFWPEALDWESRSIYIFPWVCGIFLSLFCRNVLQTKGNSPVSDWLLQFFFWVYLCGTIAFFFMDTSIIARLNSPVVAINAFSILGITIVRFWQGHKAAVYFMAGMGSFCIGLIFVAGGAMNLLGNYDVAPSILKVGASIEMILFSIALAQRINTLETLNRVTLREMELSRAESESKARLSEKMQEINRHLEEAIKSKTDFLANMSHEIRTPMNGVLGMVELAQGTDLNAEQKHYLDVAYRSGLTLLALINDILDLSKIESGKLELESVDFDLTELLADLQNLFSVPLQDKGLYFRLERDPNTPAWIKGDRTRIWQILTNLIGNAIKFTHEGGITVSMSLALPDLLTIHVTDTGIGISQGAQQNIFSSFTQADSSTTRKFGGTGLGLSISRRLAELMRGELSVTSEEGKGSRFSFTWPFQTGKNPGAESNIRVEAGMAPGNGADLRVLVAEDNEVNCMVARGMFKRLNITPTVVNDGLAATEKCDAMKFDLIFMDIQMPKLDGLSATQIILGKCTHNKSTPIIAMTADSMEGDREKCLASGMKDYIAKPIQLTELRTIILKWSALP